MDWQIWQDENLQHSHFAKAFPAYIQPANGNPDIEDFFRLEYETLFFDRFCASFGLVRIKPAGPEGVMKGENEYEATELFRKAFKWKMPRPTTG